VVRHRCGSQDPAPGLAYQQVPATTGRSFGAPAPSARLGPTLPPHRQSSQLPVSSYLPQPTTGYYEDTLPVLASPVLSRFPAIPAAPPSVVGDLKDLKSQGRQNAPPPDVATVPEFGVVTDVRLVPCACPCLPLLLPDSVSRMFWKKNQQRSVECLPHLVHRRDPWYVMH
jgi:hypothetical protein